MDGPSRLLCPWDFPGKNTRVGCPSLLQEIFLKQGLNPGLLQCRQILYRLSYPGKGPTINQWLKLTPWCHSLIPLWISYPISQRILQTLFLKYGFFFCKNLATSHHLNHYLRYCPMSRSFLEHLCQVSAPFPRQHPLPMHVYPVPIQHHRRESILLSFHICHSLIRQWITWLLSSSYKRGLRDQIKLTEKSGNEVSSWPKMIQSFYVWKLCNKVLSVRGALMTQYYNLLLNALVCVISFGKCS